MVWRQKLCCSFRHRTSSSKRCLSMICLIRLIGCMPTINLIKWCVLLRVKCAVIRASLPILMTKLTAAATSVTTVYSRMSSASISRHRQGSCSRQFFAPIRILGCTMSSMYCVGVKRNVSLTTIMTSSRFTVSEKSTPKRSG